jgi:hypothetical protein
MATTDQHLADKIKELESYIPDSGKLNNKVSFTAVAWHIDHSLRVIIGSCKMLQKSTPGEYKWRFNFYRLLIFTAGHFPRGVSRAPKTVVSHEEITKKSLTGLLKMATGLLNEILVLPANSNFSHPYFGVLDVKQTIKFINIHTRHHLKIIRDITAGPTHTLEQ